jgi:hypothetical protein
MGENVRLYTIERTLSNDGTTIAGDSAPKRNPTTTQYPHGNPTHARVVSVTTTTSAVLGASASRATGPRRRLRRGVGGETRREKSLRNGVHHANAVVWGPV